MCMDKGKAYLGRYVHAWTWAPKLFNSHKSNAFCIGVHLIRCATCCLLTLLTAEEEEDYEKEMGDLAAEDAEQIDRNMWAPEEPQKQEEEEVVYYR